MRVTNLLASSIAGALALASLPAHAGLVAHNVDVLAWFGSLTPNASVPNPSDLGAADTAGFQSAADQLGFTITIGASKITITENGDAGLGALCFSAPCTD